MSFPKSKKKRFNEITAVDPHSSNLFSASSASGHSIQTSTPKKLSAASSTDSLASNQSSVSGILRRATSSSNILAPVYLSKQKELKRKIRVLVNERNELHRRLVLKEEELQKVDSRLQTALKDRTSMMADLAVMEEERSDPRKGNEILKVEERCEKMELTTDGLESERTFLETDLQCEKEVLISPQEKLPGTETEMQQLISSYNKDILQIVTDQFTEMSRQHLTDITRIYEERHGVIVRIAEEAKRWRKLYEDLWNQVRPFKEQLEAFEREKRLLLDKIAQMENE